MYLFQIEFNLLKNETAFMLLALVSFFSIKAQQTPILDYTWTIEKIVFEE